MQLLGAELAAGPQPSLEACFEACLARPDCGAVSYSQASATAPCVFLLRVEWVVAGGRASRPAWRELPLPGEPASERKRASAGLACRTLEWVLSNGHHSGAEQWAPLGC